LREVPGRKPEQRRHWSSASDSSSCLIAWFHSRLPRVSASKHSLPTIPEGHTHPRSSCSFPYGSLLHFLGPQEIHVICSFPMFFPSAGFRSGATRESCFSRIDRTLDSSCGSPGVGPPGPVGHPSGTGAHDPFVACFGLFMTHFCPFSHVFALFFRVIDFARFHMFLPCFFMPSI